MRILVLLIVLCATPVYAQVIDKEFIFVNSALVISTIYDVETTFHAIKNCPRCYEGNPVMRPLIKSGRLATYAVDMSVNAGLVYWSCHLKKKGNKLWWMVPTTFTVGHGVAGSFNLRF